MSASPKIGHGPSLSVVIPTKNSSRWLDELLSSILAQTIADIEILVVDNGSDDGTEGLVREYEASHSEVRMLHSDAASAGGVRNAGVAEAKGTYLVFADSDDIVPDGAYRSMIDSLDASGSDMAIGDHLKFSPTNTWSPTRRWHPFDGPARAVLPRDVPQLLSGRACWNRMFRRSFWDRAGLRFPEIESLEDIEPMTRAFVSAQRIDIVDACVYLYRDRGDASSLSVGADSTVTTRYLEQEMACLQLVKDDPVLRAQHSKIVLDADGWVHLRRFLSSDPEEQAVAEVAAATSAFLRHIPLAALSDVAPARRALWELVLIDDWSTARAFVLKTSSASALKVLEGWIRAVRTLLGRGVPAAHEVLARGLVPALINEAEHVQPSWLHERLAPFSDLVLPPSGAALPDAMAAAVRSADGARVAAVSALRHQVPLVVAEVVASSDGLFLGGPGLPVQDGLRAQIHLSSAVGHGGRAEISWQSDRWHAHIRANGTVPARYAVSVEFDGIHGQFPVVTARMPLPPVERSFPLQPLADRKDGWRFIVDRRPMQHGRLLEFLMRAARKFR